METQISSVFAFAAPEGVELVVLDKPLLLCNTGKSIADLQGEWLRSLVHQAFQAELAQSELASRTLD
jgi:hypothetical protein